jgi:2-amino-4-hydroxy-6-hydroxymethyldihydropteridine diphosphokinase
MTMDDGAIQKAGESKSEKRAGGEPARERTAYLERTVYLGLGTNLGDREANLREAIERIKALGLEVARVSSIYETEPVGYDDQPWFLNQAIEARIPPVLSFNIDEEVAAQLDSVFDADLQQPAGFQELGLLYALLEIELEMGRKRAIPNGPRVIDIDMLFYGELSGFYVKRQSVESNTQIEQESIELHSDAILILPHPRLHLRRFALAPLCEIAPDLEHPRLKKTCRELLAALDDDSIARPYRASD